MKIGIVTFQETNNYGALLQNYALQTVIKKAGHEVETIDYKSAYIGKPLGIRHLKNKGLMTYLLGVAGYFIYLPRTKANKKLRSKIHYSRRVNGRTIRELANDYDLYITGSDQVWNYKLTGMDPYYMLGFVKDKSKCVSFSASIGVTEIDRSKYKPIRHYLKNYKYISVREDSAKDALSKVINNDIDVISDPTIMLGKEEWSVLATRKPKFKYVYVYQLGVSNDVVMMAKKIAKEEGLRIVFTPFPVGKPVKGRYHIAAGAEDVVSYIKNAEYVITDSFHGTMLSIIFGKKFFTKCAGTHAGVGSRIHDMLDKYGLLDRLLSDDSDYQKEIDYKRVTEVIESEKSKCFEALRKMGIMQ